MSGNTALTATSFCCELGSTCLVQCTAVSQFNGMHPVVFNQLYKYTLFHPTHTFIKCTHQHTHKTNLCYTLKVKKQNNSQDKWLVNYSTQHMDL
jgi:hypothetical protein